MFGAFFPSIASLHIEETNRLVVYKTYKRDYHLSMSSYTIHVYEQG